MKRFFIIPAASLFFLSCAVNQEIVLEGDGSGKVESSVSLEGFFLSTLQDLTDLGQADSAGKNQLDPAHIQEELGKNPFFYDISVTSPSEGEYRGSLGFNHIEELFAGASGTASTGKEPADSIMQYDKPGDDVRRLTIKINDQNFHQIFQLFPMLQDPGFQYFLPEKKIEGGEYREMLLFIFEGREEESVLHTLIDRAALKLIVKVNGRIIQREGGRLLAPDTMQIHLPLLDLLLHKEEIYYSLTYRTE